MKMFLKIIGVTILDFLIIWIWVRLMEPDPSVAIIIIILIPIVIAVNLIIAGLLFWYKNKNSKLFLLNTIISSLIVYWLFPMEINRRLNEQYNDYEFVLSDTTYRISLETHSTHHFSSTYKVKTQGMTHGWIHGTYENRGDSIFLISDSVEMYILNNKLYNFLNRKDAIAIERIEY